MRHTVGGRGKASIHAAAPWAACVLFAALAGGLSGCATSPSASSVPATDIITASDESEARKRARIRTELAVNYFEQGQITVALDEIKQALVADPTYADAFNLRGLIFMRLSDPRQAEESFRRAVALNPRDADTLHNLGWFLCEQRRFADAQRHFEQALASPLYPGRAKTLMTLGLCQARAGQRAEAERSLARSYELDAGNPITGFNLAKLLFERGEKVRAQFYIRRLNNGEFANAESLWLGVKVERAMEDRTAMEQLGEQLARRFPQSREFASYQRGAFDE